MSQKMSVPFVDLRRDTLDIMGDIRQGVLDVLESAYFIGGPTVKRFEEAFASFCNRKYAIGVANGTDAIIVALKALGIGPGDEVITAANTFVATAEAIAHVGARPVLVDIDPNTYNLKPDLVVPAITTRTKALVPVHLYGQPAAMEEILEIAQANGLYVVEDAAQAHGAYYKSRVAGSMGHVACFSFYPAKNLGALGDAGAIVTDLPSVAESAMRLRDHGGIRKYEHEIVGYNSRLDAIHAAALLTKLSRVHHWNASRAAHAATYNRLFRDLPGVVCPFTAPDTSHIFHLYVLRLENSSRDGLQEHLRINGIGSGIHYPAPVHLTPAFSYLGYSKGTFPVTEKYANQILSLPMFASLTEAEIEYVAKQVREYVSLHS